MISFPQTDFNNMCRDERSIISEKDVDLVHERFEEHKSFNSSFEYSLLRHEVGKLLYYKLTEVLYNMMIMYL